MTSKNFIAGEIRLRIAEQIDAGNICDIETFCSQYIAEKAPPECADADFYLACAQKYVREIFTKTIGKWQPPEDESETDDQLVLEGFGYLQKAYPVTRHGRQLLIPIGMLTENELESRAQGLESMATGCTKHAEELRGYLVQRRSGTVA